jgi:hypothetical protein
VRIYLIHPQKRLAFLARNRQRVTGIECNELVQFPALTNDRKNDDHSTVWGTQPVDSMSYFSFRRHFAGFHQNNVFKLCNQMGELRPHDPVLFVRDFICELQSHREHGREAVFPDDPWCSALAVVDRKDRIRGLNYDESLYAQYPPNAESRSVF